jgi:hypothetical protein
MVKREPQIILKTDERNIHLELARDGKFAAKSTGWDENRVFLEGDNLEIAVVNGRWVADAPSGGAAEARAGAPLLPGRISDAATAPVTPQQRWQRRCVAPSPVAVESHQTPNAISLRLVNSA